MKIKKYDFVELDFVAKTEDGKVFDTNLKEEAEKAKLPSANYKPIKVCIGEGFLLKGLDAKLEGKEIGKEYEIILEPEEAFGKRNPNLIKIIPLKVFQEKNVSPYPGLSVVIDNLVAIVRAVSGGRVITDFNHPLAGKKVIYKVVLRRKISSEKEKVGVILKRYLNVEDFSIRNKKIVIEKDFSRKLLDNVGKKIKDLINKDLELVVKSEAKKEKEKEEGKKKDGEEKEKNLVKDKNEKK